MNMAAPSATSTENDFDLIPVIYEVLKGFEKENHDANKLTDLKNRFQTARESAEKLPGANFTRSEQLKQIEVLRKQLVMKTELLEKYKHFDQFMLRR